MRPEHLFGPQAGGRQTICFDKQVEGPVAAELVILRVNDEDPP